jgi:type IV pilus assembly protein PilY1
MTRNQTTGWTKVKTNPYFSSTAESNLMSDFPDTEFCTDTRYTDCLRNDNYVLPGVVNGKNYHTSRNTFASGQAKFASGQPTSPVASALRDVGPHFYRIIPGEYCNSAKLRDCQTTQTAEYKYPASVRWCKDDASANAATPSAGACQAIKTNTYTKVRYPTRFFKAADFVPATPGTPAKSTFKFTLSGCTSSKWARVTELKVNGTVITTGATTQESLASNLVTSLVSKVGSGGYSATKSGTDVIVITAPMSAGALSGVKVEVTVSAQAGCIVSHTAASNAFTGYKAPTAESGSATPTYYGRFERVDITSGKTFTKYAARADCTASAGQCSYDEEMTNFANWWAYYRTRMQTMKAGVATAFDPLDDKFRIGFSRINGSGGKAIADFRDNVRTDWFTGLFSTPTTGSTPLRAALGTAGRNFAGKVGTDPMQYACQKNFALLSTDGYWNGNNGTDVAGNEIAADQDGDLPGPKKDGLKEPKTLSDIAAYYRNTDLRQSSVNNCTGAANVDVCGANTEFAHQSMITYTLGLGVSGYMQYTADYLTDTQGDFASLDVKAPNASDGTCTWQTKDTCTWPKPVADTLTAVDDLWHAAVNGDGRYFSARDPQTLSSSLSAALKDIAGKVGAAAAATTSNPNISAGDNQVFLSSFKSVDWWGELEARTLDVSTGDIGEAVQWSAKKQLDARSPSSRVIYTYASSSSSGSKRRAFEWDSLGSTERAYFEKAQITSNGTSGLSQFCSSGGNCLSSEAQTAAAGLTLFNFIRGDRSQEGVDNAKYFRARASALGDIVSSEATFVKKPTRKYSDAGYAEYAGAKASRQGVVYVGANDGMMHAFNADTGEEMWAYVPSMLLPELYRLADKSYGSKHRYYVDATPVVADIYNGTEWRTVLVSGLGAGGRAYFALDVTDPADPQPLWEFTHTKLGLSFGVPEVGKLADGTWTVMFGSGYNNTAAGSDGNGYLFVLNALTGVLAFDPIPTLAGGVAVGSTGTPSGLAHIRAWADKAAYDNTIRRVYGADLLGNVWRFDVNDQIGASGREAQRIALLKNDKNEVQPVTSRPELGLVGNSPMVFVGTGRYLGPSDPSNDQVQSVYGIKDRLTTSDYGDVRLSSANFVEQTLAAQSNGSRTIATPASVDLAVHGGWYVDLPASKERVNVDPVLIQGTLVVNSNVPGTADACQVSGFSYVNYFNFATGGYVKGAQGGLVSTKLGDALATRPAIVKLPNSAIKSITRLADATNKVTPVMMAPASAAMRRVSWRELGTD